MGDTPLFGRATSTPQASPDRLENWWAPDLGRIPKGGYSGFKVRVHDTTITRFAFDLLPATPGSAGEIKGLVVDLTDIEHAWPGQSSAVHACLADPCPLHKAEPTRYGYLLLSKQYLASKGIANAALYADGKGKWPFGTDIWVSLLARFVQENAEGLGPAAAQASSVLVAALKSRMSETR